MYGSTGIAKRVKFHRKMSYWSKFCRRDRWLGRELGIPPNIGYKLLGIQCAKGFLMVGLGMQVFWFRWMELTYLLIRFGRTGITSKCIVTDVDVLRFNGLDRRGILNHLVQLLPSLQSTSSSSPSTPFPPICSNHSSHYDHLDINTIASLGPNISYFVPLGNKDWFTSNFSKYKYVKEMDWWDEH